MSGGRGLSAEMAAATEAPEFSPLILVELEWPGGTIRAHNHFGTLSWDSRSWSGVGYLGTVSPVRESKDLRANGITVSLSGIPSELVALSLSDDYQGSPGRLYLGEIKRDGTVTVNPVQMFEGFIDVCPFDDSPDSAEISVMLEKENVDSRADGRRTTHQDQQIEYPGDMFYQYTAGLQNKDLNFGLYNASASGSASGSGGGGRTDQYAN